MSQSTSPEITRPALTRIGPRLRAPTERTVRLRPSGSFIATFFPGWPQAVDGRTPAEDVLQGAVTPAESLVSHVKS